MDFLMCLVNILQPLFVEHLKWRVNDFDTIFLLFILKGFQTNLMNYGKQKKIFKSQSSRIETSWLYEVDVKMNDNS